ncbi:DODA-type extradiol aromatic ring-opening family dioxygenase [Luteimonas abyssi]|uniref:DODA-type extradiol aromatic ring-opening family dioxygenase n=1 Tax=Luteimonas abyssi TaxID=1247514 RepID=UPI00192E5068|nr:class III extradiol ring-cleavage dioxygenase [Luteimonas abyssi]
MPTLFLSHGSPMLAVEDSPAGRFLEALAPRLPRPRAVVVASAHFAAAPVLVGAAAWPATIHDFGRFPDALFRIQYPAPGHPALAEDIARQLIAAGIAASAWPDQGLDHGVWVPLRRIFPDADIPVVPLSVNPRADARTHFALGQALASLRRDGVLVVGSGGFVHNLGDLVWTERDAPMPEWATAFADWMRARLADGDLTALLDWARRAPEAHRAHPTVEHLLPLFVALGAAGDRPRVETLHRSHEFGSLALDAFAFH